MSDRPIEEMSFEEALRELEGVVTQLESGEVPLEKSIELYERGNLLRQRCDAALAKAQEKIEKITQGSDDSATGTAPFDAQ